jgi:aspartate aminotransferase-like enzyme
MGCIDLPTDEWNCDVVISGSQKGFMIPPGLSMISMNKRAWQAYEQAKMPRYYMDLGKAKSFLEKAQTPWTPAVSIFFALDTTLDMMLKEGLENIFVRHARIAQTVRDGVKALGLTLFSDERYLSNTVTAINAGSKVDAPKLVKVLREEYDVVVAGGQKNLSGKIFRIGHLGWISDKDAELVLKALGKALPKAYK